MAAPVIQLVNNSTLVTDAQIAVWAKDYQSSIDLEIGPLWNVSATIVQVPKGQPPVAGHWIAEFVDQLPSDAQGTALAYHDVEGDVPHLICGVKTCTDAGEFPDAAMDHEIKESLVDPRANRLVQVGGKVAWLEVCDPSQKTYLGPNGTHLADFITEAFFIPGAAGPYSFRGEVKAPMTITDVGYLMVATLGGGFSQQSGPAAKALRTTPHPLSRLGRRIRRHALLSAQPTVG